MTFARTSGIRVTRAGIVRVGEEAASSAKVARNMRQAGSLRGATAASDELIEAVASKGRTIKYAMPGSDELRYLDHMGANANVGGENLTQILLRQGPRKIEVLEEFLHGTQQRIGVIDRLGVNGAEMHVKDFMVRHQRLLGISPEDAAILKQMMGQ